MAAEQTWSGMGHRWQSHFVLSSTSANISQQLPSHQSKKKWTNDACLLCACAYYCVVVWLSVCDDHVFFISFVWASSDLKRLQSHTKRPNLTTLVAVMLVFADTVTLSLLPAWRWSLLLQVQTTPGPFVPSFPSPSSSLPLPPPCACPLVFLRIYAYVFFARVFVSSPSCLCLSIFRRGFLRCFAMFCYLTQRHESTKGKGALFFFMFSLLLFESAKYMDGAEGRRGKESGWNRRG